MQCTAEKTLSTWVSRVRKENSSSLCMIIITINILSLKVSFLNIFQISNEKNEFLKKIEKNISECESRLYFYRHLMYCYSYEMPKTVPFKNGEKHKFVLENTEGNQHDSFFDAPIPNKRIELNTEIFPACQLTYFNSIGLDFGGINLKNLVFLRWIQDTWIQTREAHEQLFPFRQLYMGKICQIRIFIFTTVKNRKSMFLF